MASDLNQCNFIGRLPRDPDVRYMPNGEAVANFSIAVGSQWKDKQGQKQESTEWVNITAFGKLGEICGQYLKKGSQVFISGRMKTDKYEKDGVERYSTKIVADRMQMLSVQNAQPEQKSEPPSQSCGGASGFDDMDDEQIPF